MQLWANIKKAETRKGWGELFPRVFAYVLLFFFNFLSTQIKTQTLLLVGCRLNEVKIAAVSTKSAFHLPWQECLWLGWRQRPCWCWKEGLGQISMVGLSPAQPVYGQQRWHCSQGEEGYEAWPSPERWYNWKAPKFWVPHNDSLVKTLPSKHKKSLYQFFNWISFDWLFNIPFLAFAEQIQIWVLVKEQMKVTQTCWFFPYFYSTLYL